MQETETMPVVYAKGNSGSVELSLWRVSCKRKKEVIMVPKEGQSHQENLG